LAFLIEGESGTFGLSKITSIGYLLVFLVNKR
jgi:hypothetical protein